MQKTGLAILSMDFRLCKVRWVGLSWIAVETVLVAYS